MATSSIHIQSGGVGFFAHNSRETETVNSIFTDEENYCSCNFDTAVKTYRSELATRTEAYKENFGREKLHAKTITHLSAIVNFNKEHTPADIQKVCDHLEKTLDTKVIQFSMHRDEGHIDENGIAQKNYHAHIEFIGLDSTGQSVRRKLDKKYLSNLQTDTAKILKMERGINYIKEQKPRPKRLDTHEYKKSMQKINDLKAEHKLEIKKLKAEQKAERALLQSSGTAGRAEYAELEAKYKDLEEKYLALQKAPKVEKIDDRNLDKFIADNMTEKTSGLMSKTVYKELDESGLKRDINNYIEPVIAENRQLNRKLEKYKEVVEQQHTALVKSDAVNKKMQTKLELSSKMQGIAENSNRFLNHELNQAKKETLSPTVAEQVEQKPKSKVAEIYEQKLAEKKQTRTLEEARAINAENEGKTAPKPEKPKQHQRER